MTLPGRRLSRACRGGGRASPRGDLPPGAPMVSAQLCVGGPMGPPAPTPGTTLGRVPGPQGPDSKGSWRRQGCAHPWCPRRPPSAPSPPGTDAVPGDRPRWSHVRAAGPCLTSSPPPPPGGAESPRREGPGHPPAAQVGGAAGVALLDELHRRRGGSPGKPRDWLQIRLPASHGRGRSRRALSGPPAPVGTGLCPHSGLRGGARPGCPCRLPQIGPFPARGSRSQHARLGRASLAPCTHGDAHSF